MPINYQPIANQLLQTLNVVMDDLNTADQCFEDTEGVVLGHGDQTLQFQTEFEPVSVYVSLVDTGTPVCGGELSTSSVSLLPNGFILYVHVASDSAVVKWVIKY